MKTLYTVLFALVMGFGLNAQVVFESNLDNWNDSLPNDWFGFKTSLEYDSIAQSTDAPTWGTALAELTNTESGHKRFTTQQLTLTEGETYEVEIWVKGEGDIRTNLYDGDLDGGDFGYQNYNPYVAVTGGAIQSFVQIVSPDTTSNIQELIISVRNGVLLIDRVELRVGVPVDPVNATINEIQFTADPSGDSPFSTQIVNTTGVVTAVAEFGYYMQDGSTAWNGIYVNDATNVPAIGDEIMLSGLVEEYFNFTRLKDVENYAVVSSGNSFTPIVASTLELNDEQYEGMMVTATVAECIELPNMFGEWLVDDGSGQVMVDDQIYVFDPTLGQYYEVTGAMNYAFSEFKIEPRDMNDISAVSSLNELQSVQFSIFPNPVSDMLTLSLQEEINDQQVMLVDELGRVVYSRLITDATTQIDLSQFDRGVYLLSVSGTDSRSTSTIILE